MMRTAAPTRRPQLFALSRRPTGDVFHAGTLRHLGLSLKKQWKLYRRGLKRCQKKFSENGVHESRVEARRLLSISELLGPFLPEGRVEKIRVCLKRHLDAFDDLRDTHVQLLIVGKLRKAFPVAGQFHAHLKRCEERFERKARKNIKRIKTKRLGKLVAASREDASRWQGAGTLAEINSMLLQALTTAFRRTADLKAAINPARTATIHCTRVAFKRFRYMMELVKEFFPHAAPGLLASMHRYQTLMGDVQDLEVVLLGFEKLVRKKKTDPVAAAQFRQELLRRRAESIARYLARADQLCAFWPESVSPEGNGNGASGRLAAIGKSSLARHGHAQDVPGNKNGP